jgi:transcriptional regulator with XRE-family HTH domain
MKFNEILRNARKEKGLSLRDVAKEIGISNAYLSQLETGSKNSCSAKIFFKFVFFYKEFANELIHTFAGVGEYKKDKLICCKDCIYWDENTEDGPRYCRINPPIISDGGFGVWPITLGYYKCGKGKRKII